MKVILEFDLPEEEAPLRWAQNGEAAYRVLRALREWLRGGLKHTKRPPSAQTVWERLHEIAQEEHLDPEDWC